MATGGDNVHRWTQKAMIKAQEAEHCSASSIRLAGGAKAAAEVAVRIVCQADRVRCLPLLPEGLYRTCHHNG
eukprot:193902-Pelagomonas_calceolata.AAC.1